MINAIESHTQFNNLSVKDLLEARDLFHVHLMNKANVIGTAIGRYRIRNEDVAEGKIIKRPPGYKHLRERTLGNSQVVDESWPCILVFVSAWKTKEELKQDDNIAQYIPPNVYMPDGRIVPICVVEAPAQVETDPDIDESLLDFPESAIGGGYPLLIYSQGITKVASVGAIVTDGNKYYALTNKHVTGTPGSPIYSVFKGHQRRIGLTTSINIGNTLFQSVYTDWVQPNLFVNVDVGLIEIDNINDWKTDIYGLGQLGKVVDLNTRNITLKLIGVSVAAHGAVTGNMEGEISALFYRYKSIAGYEYVADFLIGPKLGQGSLKTRHGDSGTIWVIPPTSTSNAGDQYLPLAIQWGQRAIIDGETSTTNTFALATNLSHICRDLDIEIVRGWNLDLDFTWGKTGHFKVGYAACNIVTNVTLKKLLSLNADNIGINDDDLIAGNVPPGLFTEEFVSMTDVPDMYWRTKRPADKSNHFADMDDHAQQVLANKTLLDLCFENGVVVDEWVDVEKWLDFYKKLDEAKPEKNESGHTQARLGGLPFRVWQMYNEMVTILNGPDADEVKLAKFVVAGGTMSHYVGDACQPLHISYLHDGYPDGRGEGVHTAYETKMLDTYKKKAELNFLSGITDLLIAVSPGELIRGGKNAARLVLTLMYTTYQLIPPQDIVDNFAQNRSVKKLFDAFGEKTKQTIANGAHTMAVLWQSAWVEGGGDLLSSEPITFEHQTLMDWYKTPSFVQSYKLNDPALKPLLT